ncbi:MAG: cardiolipin synthase [Lachnospiraceae bacterium]|nr:cardiolipin synthase [Lachnospiraceae bacterium]
MRILSKLLNILQKRVVVVGLIILVQILWGLSMLTKLTEYSDVLNKILELISFFTILYIISKDDNPAYKLAWIIPILLFPLFGGILYLCFGDKRPTKGMRIQMDKASAKISAFSIADENLLDKIKEEDRIAYGQMRYINDYAHYPAYKNTESYYYKSGEECYPVLLEELKKAKHFIFMEYFIVEEDTMWNEILEILVQKAESGVEVRFMYDDMGCVTLLPYKYYKKLEAAGIKSVAFNPVIPFFSLVMNHRDHRKITVIDGNVGFMGGWNIADEYINRKERFGYWKDTGVMLRGDAVWNLTSMFLITWNSVKMDKEEDIRRFMPGILEPNPVQAEGYVQPYGDSPLDRENVSESVFLNMINGAQDYIYMTTPYLVIDNEMMTALILAAKRGVDVRIVTPGIPDKKYVYILTQSYYSQLVSGGVKIYQYNPGFVHAKSFVCDDKFAIVGTINLDYRSLYLHFECGTFFYRTPVVTEVKNDLLDTMEQSSQQTYAMTQRKIFMRLTQAVLRVLAPLM